MYFSCVINGKAGEKPSHICFQPDFQEGSQLTIVSTVIYGVFRYRNCLTYQQLMAQNIFTFSIRYIILCMYILFLNYHCK